MSNFIPFTFKSTGVEIQIRPVSPLLAQRAHQSIPKPIPPMERVENPDGSFRDEPNPNHPSYAEAMKAWREAIEQISRDVYIENGIEMTLSEDQKKDVDALRARMAKKGVTLDDDDVTVFIAYRAIGSNQDYIDFLNVVSGESQPTGPK